MSIESSSHNKSSIGWVIPTVALTVGAYIAWPYISMWQLYSALRSQDADALTMRIDFPSLRTSLKVQVNAFVMAETVDKQQMADNPWAGLAVAVLPKIVDSMIDAYVTPAGVTQLFETNTLNGTSPTGKPQTSAPASGQLKDVKFAFFSNPSRFLLKTKDVDFVFRLRDWTWKLAEVKLTPSALQSMEAKVSKNSQEGSDYSDPIRQASSADPRVETGEGESVVEGQSPTQEEAAISLVENLYHLLSEKQFDQASSLYTPQLADFFAPGFFNKFERVTVEDLKITSRTDSSINFLGENAYVYRDGSTQREARSYTVRSLDGELKLTASEFIKVTKPR